MGGNRLTRKEMFIIERTKREGEANAEASGGRERSTWGKVRFYLWFILVFAAMALAAMLMYTMTR